MKKIRYTEEQIAFTLQQAEHVFLLKSAKYINKSNAFSNSLISARIKNKF